MDLKILANQAGEWLRGTGPESDIVISSRIRLARNIARFPFLSRATTEQRKEILSTVRQALEEIPPLAKLHFFNLDELSSVDRHLLFERHLISKELTEDTGPRAVGFLEWETMSIMINEEDHIRIQVLHSGFQLEPTWSYISDIDDHLSEKIEYAFSSHFGYLTACPTNVGTGLRVSVMLHLPALVMTKQIEKVFNAIAKINLVVRGLYGEGTQATGDFYQISNQNTLGKAEEEILDNLNSVVPQIIEYERHARQALLTENHIALEDRIWRAYGMLKAARTISSEETASLLSAIRMGVNLGLLTDIDIATVNKLFILSQPAHLQKLFGSELNPTDRDPMRATYIRNILG